MGHSFASIQGLTVYNLRLDWCIYPRVNCI